MDQNYNDQTQKPQGGKGIAIASLILGIVAVVFSCFFTYVSVPCGIVGLILGIIGMKKCPTAKGMAIAGLVLSIVSLVLVILAVTVLVGLFASMGLSM